jgi:hypothetical protein
MTAAERALLAKARAGHDVSTDDKLSAIDTIAGVEWFRAGLKLHGLDTPENLSAVARRKVALQLHR